MLTAAALSLSLILAADTVSFSSDWESGQLKGPGNWRSTQIMAPDRFQLVTDIVRQGRYAARVEVRPGDDPINSSGERAEVSTMSDRDGNPLFEDESSGVQFFAFSVRLAPDWQPPTPEAGSGWATVLQLHGPNSLKASPSIAVRVLDHFAISLHAGNLDDRAKAAWHESHPFKNYRLAPGKWVDLVLRVKLAKDFTGEVDVWRRDEGQVSFTHELALRRIPTLQYASGIDNGLVGKHYWKHGLYRSKDRSITNVLWLDGLTRANSFEAAIRSAFNAPPATAMNLRVD